MINLFFAFVLNIVPQAAAQKCEVVGPRIDGIRVTICDGRAVAYTDASGNTIRPADYSEAR